VLNLSVDQSFWPALSNCSVNSFRWLPDSSLRLKINFEKTEEQEPDFARLHAKGTGVGALMDMDTAFNLRESDGTTAMAWEADVRIAGPVGSMGQRVLQPIVNQQVQNVLTALEKQVASAT